MAISLFKISADYKKQLDKLMEISELDQKTINDTLESISTDVENKILNLAALCKNLEGEAELMRGYEHNMGIRRKRHEVRIDNLKRYIQSCMEHTGITRVNNAELSVGVRKNQASLKINDESKIPPEFIIIKTETEFDNKAIKEKLKSGCALGYAELFYTKSLVIKS